MCIVRTKGGGCWRSWGSGVLGIHWPAPTPRQTQLARVSELQSSRVPGDGAPWAARGGGAVVDYVVDNGRYAFYVTDCVYVSAGVLPGYYVNIYIMQQVEYIYTHITTRIQHIHPCKCTQARGYYAPVAGVFKLLFAKYLHFELATQIAI